MIHSKLLDNNNENNNENNNLIFSENLYKGACVKIKNSNKTFQVIGLNRGKEICWVREWPFACNSKKTFALEINQITLQIFCSNNSSEKLSNYIISAFGFLSIALVLITTTSFATNKAAIRKTCPRP